MKRMISLTLSVLLIFALTACGSQSGGATQDTGAAAAAGDTETAPDSSPPTDGAADEAPADQGGSTDDIYELTIIEPNYSGNNELRLVDEYIKDKFGIVINHVPYQGDAQELMMIQLASKDYGEVQRMEYDRIYKAYYSAGVLQSLEPYLDMLPDFQRVFEEAIPYWRMGADGDLCRWDVDVPLHGEMDIEACDSLIRTDVLEYYGWPTLVSEDDWVAFLKQALIDFPETDGMPSLGMVVPFAESWGLSSIATINYEKGDTFTELSNVDGGVLFNMKTDKFVDYFKEPSVKECYAFFNRLYREGILDVESLTDDFPAVQNKLNSGSAISAYYIMWAGGEANAALTKAGKEHMSYINMPIQSNTQVAEGQKRAIRVEDTRIFNAWGITDNCRYPERIVELINWACTDEGQIILSCGLEGQQWIRNAEGKREYTEDGIKSIMDPDYNRTVVGRRAIPFAPHFNLLLSDGQFPDPMSHSEVADKYLTPRVKEAYDKMGWSSSKSWWVENGFFAATGLPGVISIDPADPLTDVSNKLFELRVKVTANLILAETEQEFEDIYAAAVIEHDKLNPQAVVDKYNEIYRIEKAKLTN